MHTICGLSNVSFGLPRRRLLNRAFLVAAMTAGLDPLIPDPLDTGLMALLRAAAGCRWGDSRCRLPWRLLCWAGERQVPEGGPAIWRLAEEAVRFLGLDAVGVVAGAGGPGSAGGGLTGPAWPEEVGYWTGPDLFFVWAVVDGPWQGLAAAVGWSQALLFLSRRHGAARPGAVAEPEGLLLLQLDGALAEVGRGLGAGADGVVLGEDVAYADGLWMGAAQLVGPRAVGPVGRAFPWIFSCVAARERWPAKENGWRGRAGRVA